MLFGSNARRARLLDFDLSKGDREAPYRVVFLADRLDATYYAYFHHALQPMAEGRQLAFHALSSERVRQWSAPAELVDALIGQVAPQLVVLVRYALPFGEPLLQHFRKRGVASLYHIDDDLLSLPPDLGKQVLADHGRAAVVDARERLLAQADFVIPSTAHLAEVVRARVPGAMILPPMPPPYLGAQILSAPSKHRNGPATIGYMASKSHGADLDLVLPAVRTVLDRRAEARFEVFGTLPLPADPVRLYGSSRVRSHPPAAGYAQFLAQLAQLSWAVGLAPLLPNAFNQCKSAIKFLEYTACGIPVVASSGEVYDVIEHRRNGLVADTVPAWSEAMSLLLDDPGLANALVDTARQDCEKRFPPAGVAARILDLIRRL